MSRKFSKFSINNLSYKNLLIILLFLLISIVVLVKFVLPKKASAAWWNDGWNYRIAYPLTNTLGSTLTNQRAKIIMDTSALVTTHKLQSNCNDLRVTDINGNLLDHWTTGCNTASTNVYIKLPTLSTSGTSIYVYYGNPSAQNIEKPLGTIDTPGTSCAMMKAQGSAITNGTYYIVPGGADADEQFVYCDQTNDGGGWTLVMNQKSDTGGFFANSTEAQSYHESNPTADRYSILGKLAKFKDNGVFTFKMNWPTLNSSRNIWSQTSNPISENIAGYTAITIDQAGCAWGGIAPSQDSGSAFIDGSPNSGSGSWWFAIATYGQYSVGIPGYCNSASTQAQLWVKGNDTMNNVTVGTPLAEEVGGGPVAYWKFDEGSGTTVYDSSPNKINGVLAGSTLPTWQTGNQCVSGKCLNFNGSNSNILVTNPSNNSLNFGTGDFTVEFWINYHGTTVINQTPGTVINKSTSNSNNPGFFSGITTYGGNGSNYGIIFSTTNGAWGAGNVEHTGSYSPNTWYHVTGVRSGSTFTIYKNGAYGTSTTKAGVNVDIGNTQNLTIGRGSWGYINAQIDDVKIYPYARTAAQIKLDYNSRGSSSGSSASLGSANSDSNLYSGLVGYWKFDESSGPATDSSGNNNSASVSGSDNYGLGKFGNGFRSGIATTNLITNPSFETGLTGWNYQFASTGSDSTTTTKSLFGSNSLMLTRGVGGSEVNVYYSLSGLAASTTYYYSTWAWANTASTACIYTYNGTTNLSAVCHSGSGQWERIGGTFVSSATGTIQLRLGHTNNSQINSVYFDGVQVELGSTLTNYFDGSMGTGISWTGTAHASTSIRTASAGLVNNSTSLDISNNQISFGAWVYLQTYGQTNNVVFQKSGWTQGYRMMINSTGHAILSIGESQGGGMTTNGVIPLNIWTHIALTYDGQKMNGYINGKLDNTKSYTNNLTSTSAGINFGPTEYPNISGLTDEVRIYNRALSSAEVNQLFNHNPNLYGLAQKPIAYWKFDEGGGSTVFNSGNSGASLNGSIINATWTDGKFGKALNYDGTGDYTSIPNNSALNFGLNSFSVSYLMNFNPGTTQERWSIGKGNPYLSGGPGWAVANWTTGDPINPSLYVSDGTGGLSHSIPFKNMARNTWHQLTFVVNRSQNLVKTYLDGVYAAQLDISSFGSFDSSDNLLIGTGNGTGNTSDVKIDEVKIYNTALSPDQVKQDYNHGSALNFGATNQTIGGTTTDLNYCIPGDTSYCASPIGEWNFEENTGTITKDTSGNNIQNTLFNTNWVPGKNGSGLNFNGTSSSVGTSLAFAGNSYTAEAWIKPNSTAANTTVFAISPDASNYTLWTYLNGSEISTYNFTNSVQTTSGAGITVGKWYHLAITSTQAGPAYVYVNGILKGSFTSGNTAAAGNFTIGDLRPGRNLNFNGVMDNVKIYNYIRTPAQVAYDYNKGGPVAWWKFDECQGSVVNDSSGMNNTGSISIGSSGTQTSVGTCTTSGTAWGNGASGHTNSSLNFDGKDDYITKGSSINTGNNFSVFAWVKPQAAITGRNMVVTNGYPYQTDKGWLLGFQSNNAFFVSIGQDNAWAQSANSIITNGSWNFIGATVTNGGAIINLYLNGKLISNATGTLSARNISYADNSFYIGMRSGEYFNGQIDDVRLYNYALTSDQVKQLYNGGAVSFN